MASGLQDRAETEATVATGRQVEEDETVNDGELAVILDRPEAFGQRVIAQVDVCFSNSLIEAWWRSLDGMNRREVVPGREEER
jgi:hypothetical protein